MPFHQMDVDGFKSNLFLLSTARYGRANGNQLYMQSLIGLCSAVLIHPEHIVVGKLCPNNFSQKFTEATHIKISQTEVLFHL